MRSISCDGILQKLGPCATGLHEDARKVLEEDVAGPGGPRELTDLWQEDMARESSNWYDLNICDLDSSGGKTYRNPKNRQSDSLYPQKKRP